MKKLVISSMTALSLLSINLMAEENNSMYTGLDYGFGKAHFESDGSGTNFFNGPVTDDKTSENTQDFKFKLGFLLDDGWRIQGYYLQQNIDNFDNDYGELGVDVIKAFDLDATPVLKPYLIGGVGLGYIDTENTWDGGASAISLKAGTGFIYEINENWEALAGVELRSRSFEEKDLIGGGSVEVSDTSVNGTLGINYKF